MQYALKDLLMVYRNVYFVPAAKAATTARDHRHLRLMFDEWRNEVLPPPLVSSSGTDPDYEDEGSDDDDESMPRAHSISCPERQEWRSCCLRM